MLRGVLGGAVLFGLCYLFYKLHNHVVAVKELNKRRVKYYAEQELLVRANEREREQWHLEDLAAQKEKAAKKAKKEFKTQQMESVRREANSPPHSGGASSVPPAHFVPEESAHSDPDRSVELSSLHTSEMSDNDAIMERERRQFTQLCTSPLSLSRESAMEEGLQIHTRTAEQFLALSENESESDSDEDGCSDDSDDESDDGMV